MAVGMGTHMMQGVYAVRIAKISAVGQCANAEAIEHQQKDSFDHVITFHSDFYHHYTTHSHAFQPYRERKMQIILYKTGEMWYTIGKMEFCCRTATAPGKDGSL